jgi:MFS family permease
LVETTADGVAVSAPSGAAEHSASPGYRRYVTAVILVICALNFLDRSVINILAEPIKHEFGLKDWQLGMLTGFYFAAFYSILSIPLARMADRGDRARMITVCLAVWSLFTVGCGLVRTYAQLAICRLLVGVGEAGGAPTSQALITDYAPKDKRASAMALYTIGIPIGSLLGLALGGLVLDRFGWRVAFLFAGAPGLLIAALTAVTLKEPRKAFGASAADLARDAPPLGAALAEIFSKRAFVLTCLGAMLVAFVNYAQSAWLPSFFFRNHAADLSGLAKGFSVASGWRLGPAGFLGPAMGLVSGVAGIVGTLGGGWITDRAAKRDVRAYVTVQVVFTTVRLPLFLLAMIAPTVPLALLALGCQSLCTGIAGAPAYASIQGMVQPRVRATASAIFLLGMNLVGLGLGPVSMGALSDYLAAHGHGAGGGLRLALLVISEVILLAAVGLISASRRTFHTDTVS